MGAVLHHFQHTAELSLFISNRIVNDINKEVRLVDPKLRLVLLSGTKLFDDFLNDMYRSLWMTVFHISSDDIFTSGKNSVLGVGVEAYQFIFVHIGKIHRHVLVNQVNLIQGKLTGSNIQLFFFIVKAVFSQKTGKLFRKTGSGRKSG